MSVARIYSIMFAEMRFQHDNDDKKAPHFEVPLQLL